MADMPKLRLYNTLTRAKEDFVPLDANNVRMYVCGPTVYDFAHIGNARPVIVFDVLYRLLRHLYGEKHVTYVRNITDIDDKINKRAFERWNRTGSLLDEVKTLTQVTAAQYEADVAALGCLPPTHSPRATAFVCDSAQNMDMVRVIERLVTKGQAYAAEGHVLFHVPSMPNYGKLSRRPLDDMIAGARVEVAPYKKDPMDFVLWKPSDPETEPGWDSPWGFGRPGWHIECSAMSGALLGEQFDIHAGGIDLIFPHHENEIAQSCCAFGVDKMASVWMHNGFLQVEGQKMSKSAGNFFTIQDVLKDWPGEVVRLNMLKTHYRQPIDWTVRGLEESEADLAKWTSFIEDNNGNYNFPNDQPIGLSSELIAALSDDLNTSTAISYLHKLCDSSGNKHQNSRLLSVALKFIGFTNVDKPGLFRHNYWFYPAKGTETAQEEIYFIIKAFHVATANSAFDQQSDARNALSLNGIHVSLSGRGDVEISSSEIGLEEKNNQINALITSRNAARAAKNFDESDRIRDELLGMGIQLKDGKDPVTGEPITTWEVKR